MFEYSLELSPAAMRDYKKLPLQVQKNLALAHLDKIKENPFKNGKPLVGALRNERSYHFGRKPEYRVIYYVEGKCITVTVIGTREDIYKKAKGRR
jgi:addiction module RelE/StbE family toxin